MPVSWVLVAYLGTLPITNPTIVKSGFDSYVVCEVALRFTVSTSVKQRDDVKLACITNTALKEAQLATPDQQDGKRAAPLIDGPHIVVPPKGAVPFYFEWALVLVQPDSGRGPTASDVLAEHTFKWKSDCELALRDVNQRMKIWLSTKPAGSWPYNTSYSCHRRRVLAGSI